MNTSILKNKLAFLLFLLATALVSCQKEADLNPSSGNNASNILGNWNFVSLNGKVSQREELSDPLLGSIKTVATIDYLTTANTGTLKVEPSKMTMTGLGYHVQTDVKMYLYENNVLIDSVITPMQYTAPPSNSELSYRLIGADSIHFDGGMISFTGSPQQSSAIGGKIRFEGNKMIWTIPFSEITSEIISGIRQTTESKATAIFTFQR